MNRLNWVQQEQNTEYHVIQWKNSAFHNHHVKKDKEPVGGMGPFSVAKVVGGAIGQAQVDDSGHGESSCNSSLGIGGSGSGVGIGNGSGTVGGSGWEGRPMEGAGKNDGLILSSESVQKQKSVMMEEPPVISVQYFDDPEQVKAVAAGMAAGIPAEQKAGDNSVEVSGEKETMESISGLKQGNIRNRLKDSAKRLQDIYQKYKEKLSAVPVKEAKQKEPDRMQGGTRSASKEELFAMQAENHYLLDSYDKNGRYSILGK